jgi:polysaccharide biosynthesis/export protein
MTAAVQHLPAHLARSVFRLAGRLALLIAVLLFCTNSPVFAQTHGSAGTSSMGMGAPSTGTGAQSTVINIATPAPASTPAAAAPAAPSGNPAMLYPGEDFKLSPGDLISVSIFQEPDYQSTVRINEQGAIQLPLLGSVPLEGLTVHEAQARIADRLRTGGFYRDPTVIIQVLDTVNSTVTITGEMHVIVPVSTERSLRDVLLTAGGLPAAASHTIKIVRPGMENPIVVNLGTDLASSTAANVPVRPHDIIQISRASVVYVLGAFAHQGQIPLDQAQPLTLLQAAALSGGINFEGRFNDLRLIRTVMKDGKPDRVLVAVDIKKIRDGKADDPILQANDIVFLPTDAMKASLKSLGSGGILSLVSILIAAHSF